MECGSAGEHHGGSGDRVGPDQTGEPEVCLFKCYW